LSHHFEVVSNVSLQRENAMSREIITVFDPESAKAIQKSAELGEKAVDAATGVGRYSASVLANLPHDLVGIAGDYISLISEDCVRLNWIVNTEEFLKNGVSKNWSSLVRRSSRLC
jgi:hypothetical protein